MSRPEWTNVGHQRTPFMSTPQPSWVDEFLDFSSAKRGAHRRSASDSVAFLEAPLEVDNGGRGVVVDMAPSEFDRLDDHQLMSMFPDDVPPAPDLNPSTRSDFDGGDEQKRLQEVKNETEEAPASHPEPPNLVDPKRVKRILANRQSAQRSRVRKLQYISELERSVTYLQTEVSALSPRVAFLDHQRSVLTVGNSALRQRIAALAQDKIFKDAHQEALKKEIERLSRVYHQQNLKKMGTSAGTTTAAAAAVATTTEPMSCTDNELVSS